MNKEKNAKLVYNTEEMSDSELNIGKNVRDTLTRRKIPRRSLAVGTPAHYSAVYRVLNDSTKDPRISTMIGICQSLGTSMNEILGYEVNHKEGILEEMQRLPDPDKKRAIALIRTFVETKDVRKARNS